jgi:glucokinase
MGSGGKSEMRTDELAIGIDLGGTQVRAALVEGGRVLRRAAEATDVKGGPGAVVRQFKRLLAEICGADDLAKLAGVGIAAPGPLDSETGTILHIPTLPDWESFALGDTLKAEFGLPVVVENDGIAAAYGEWQYGAGRGLRHLVYVTVSTGIGGGVVVDGRLMHGWRGMGGHVGHFRMAPEGPVCACGATACFEAFASGTALGRRARRLAQDNPSSMLGQMAATGAVDARHLIDGARQGDPLCLKLLQDEAMYLGSGLTGLIHLFSPQRVILGGGVSNAFDLLEQGIYDVIRRDAMQPFKTVPVVPAGLGHNSGLIGAAALAVAARYEPAPT